MKTYIAKPQDIKQKWLLIDATNKVVGKLSTMIADKLRGKDKAIFSPHMDCGEYIVIINAEKVKLTANKLQNKMYARHSGFPGGYKEASAKEVLAKKPGKILELAIYGMLPKNKLRKHFMSKVKIYPGEKHPHEAQQPINLEV